MMKFIIMGSTDSDGVSEYYASFPEGWDDDGVLKIDALTGHGESPLLAVSQLLDAVFAIADEDFIYEYGIGE